MDELSFGALFDLKRTVAADYLTRWEKPWEALPALSEIIRALINTLRNEENYTWLGDGVLMEKSARVASSALVAAPTILCAGAELRHGAFIRGNAIIGRDAVVGNSVEVKNAILFDAAQAPHFNYVGDSILGYKAHLGAGAVTSNLKSDKTPVVLHFEGREWNTGLKKLGALVGDNAEIGCNCVLNPGTVIGRNATVYPLSSVRGYVPGDHIYKSAALIVKKEAR